MEGERVEMKHIAIFFATGYEEIEALTVVDICRRCGLEIDMISITEEYPVEGSHGMVVGMDRTFSEVNFESYDMLVLPGGMPGTKNLESCQALMEQVDGFYRKGKWVAAICAAPSIFGHRGFLNGKRACCYPGFEEQLEGAEVTTEAVEISQNVITSRGMGTAIPFALAIIRVCLGEEKAEEMAKAIVFRN